MRYPIHTGIVRLRVTPIEPADDTSPPPYPGPRPKGARRPHSNAKVAEVRRLIEQTVLNYDEISKRTGVGRASICRWTRDGGWKRHCSPRAPPTPSLPPAPARSSSCATSPSGCAASPSATSSN